MSHLSYLLLQHKMQNFKLLPPDWTQRTVWLSTFSRRASQFALQNKPATCLEAYSNGYSHIPSKILSHAPFELSNCKSQLMMLSQGVSPTLEVLWNQIFSSCGSKLQLNPFQSYLDWRPHLARMRSQFLTTDFFSSFKRILVGFL